jgi:hypothetical protein
VKKVNDLEKNLPLGGVVPLCPRFFSASGNFSE